MRVFNFLSLLRRRYIGTRYTQPRSHTRSETSANNNVYIVICLCIVIVLVSLMDTSLNSFRKNKENSKL